MRRLVAATALPLAIGSLTACGGSAPIAARPPSAKHADPPTVQVLLRIARQFNKEYAANDDDAVYDRWDTRSRKIISAGDYIRRHQRCPTAPGPAIVSSAVPLGPWWIVHYSISDTDLTDYWRYEHGRWTFDLIRSNPKQSGSTDYPPPSTSQPSDARHIPKQAEPNGPARMSYSAIGPSTTSTKRAATVSYD